MEQKEELFDPSLSNRVKMGLEEGGEWSSSWSLPSTCSRPPDSCSVAESSTLFEGGDEKLVLHSTSCWLSEPAPGACGLGQSFHFIVSAVSTKLWSTSIPTKSQGYPPTFSCQSNNKRGSRRGMKVMHWASLFVSNHNARESQSLEVMGSGFLSRLMQGCRWVWVIAPSLFRHHQLCCLSWGRTGGSQCLLGGSRGCGLGVGRISGKT